MGTRGFTGWKIDGTMTLVYQQFDSYPSYTGHRVATDLAAIQEQIATDLLNANPELKRDLRALTESVRASLRQVFKGIERLTDDTELTPELVARLVPVTDTGVSTGSDIYALTRELQGNLAGMVEHGVAYHYGDDWPLDSVFCEWGYLLNFDADEGLGRLEVYRGFQSASPTVGEWAGSSVHDGYSAVNLVRWFSLVPPPTPDQVADVEEQVYRAERPQDYAADVVDELAADGITATVRQITD